MTFYTIGKFINRFIIFLLLCWSYPTNSAFSQLTTINLEKPSIDEYLIVKKCNDFAITGIGDNSEWNKQEWFTLTKLDSGGTDYKTTFKIMYSHTGIYLLFHGEDQKITSKDYQDYRNIFNGDVFEVFFHPHPEVPVYFEYEINPLDKELVLMFGRIEGQQGSGWIPWNEGGRNNSGIKKLVTLEGGEKKLNSPNKSWTAELFIPYSTLGLLPGVPPKSGDAWHANFCRLDYDSGKMIKYSWSPGIRVSFHELEKFREMRFE